MTSIELLPLLATAFKLIELEMWNYYLLVVNNQGRLIHATSTTSGVVHLSCATRYSLISLASACTSAQSTRSYPSKWKLVIRDCCWHFALASTRLIAIWHACSENVHQIVRGVLYIGHMLSVRLMLRAVYDATLVLLSRVKQVLLSECNALCWLLANRLFVSSLG